MRIRSDCGGFDRDLAAFVDGELRGPRVLRLLRHLEHCHDCTAKADGVRDLGESLRAEAPADPDPRLFDGLAGTIISRTRAEDSESWLGHLRRAREDWHWVVVGAGAVAATFMSTVLLSALLAFGPKPERGDSLSALTWPATGLLLAMPAGSDQASVVMKVDDVGPMASRASVELVSRVVDQWPSEADLVDALLDVVTHNGRAVPLDSLDPYERRYADALLQEISRLRSIGPVPISAAVSLRQMRLEVLTSVSAKGL